MSSRTHRIVAVALILFAATVAAEHEADHRYNVRGYVLSADRRPLDAVPVTIRKDGQFIGSGRTDGEGYYTIHLHLHDSDIGATLAVRAGEHQAGGGVSYRRDPAKSPQAEIGECAGGTRSGKKAQA